MAFPRHSLPEQTQDQQQHRRGNRYACPDQGEGRQITHSHAVKEKRGAPDHGKSQQHAPLPAAHVRRRRTPATLCHPGFP
jgi:hypothetical protein